jgi:hypothetical protein
MRSTLKVESKKQKRTKKIFQKTTTTKSKTKIEKPHTTRLKNIHPKQQTPKELPTQKLNQK